MASSRAGSVAGSSEGRVALETARQTSFGSTASSLEEHPSPPDGDVYQKMVPLNSSSSMDFSLEDDEGELSGADQKLTKRDIHTLNEQRRRDMIKVGYSQLMELVPTCRSSSNKPSRAIILQRTIEYILYVHSQANKQQDKLQELEKEVKALKIMKENYEHIAKVHQSASSPSNVEVPDNIKFQVFQGIADQLFQSFNSSICITSFDTASSCIISWLEEYCKPQTLREIVMSNLRRVDSLIEQYPPSQASLPPHLQSGRGTPHHHHQQHHHTPHPLNRQ